MSKPFLVAEAGVNYYDIAKEENISLLEAAKLMVSEAAKAGADAIKFQTYQADKLAIRDSPAYWDIDKEASKTQYELFTRYDKFEEREYTWSWQKVRSCVGLPGRRSKPGRAC